MIEDIFVIRKIKPRLLCSDLCETKNCRRKLRYVLVPKIFINSKPDYRLCVKCFRRFENEFESDDLED
jgi:hypothetical protein